MSRAKIWLSAHVHASVVDGHKGVAIGKWKTGLRSACGRPPSPTLRTSTKRELVTCRSCRQKLKWDPSGEEKLLRAIFGEPE